MSSGEASAQEDPALTEWQTARSMISDFDGRSDDLRKYGFSFITALLTAESLLLPSNLLGGTGGSGVPDVVKLGVLSVTLILIVGLRQVEKVYQLYQKAANIRAIILERKLNLELSETVTERWSKFHISWRIGLVYASFAVGDAALGSVILGDLGNKIILLGFTVAALVLIWYIGRSDLSYSWGNRKEEADWTLSNLELSSGDSLKITLTNLSDKDKIEFTDKDPVCRIRPTKVSANLAGEDPIELRVDSERPVTIRPWGTYSWLWTVPNGLPDDVYRVFPTVNKKFFRTFGKKEQNDLVELSKRLALPQCPDMSNEIIRWVYPSALSREILVTNASPSLKGQPSVNPPDKSKGA